MFCLCKQFNSKTIQIEVLELVFVDFCFQLANILAVAEHFTVKPNLSHPRSEGTNGGSLFTVRVSDSVGGGVGLSEPLDVESAPSSGSSEIQKLPSLNKRDPQKGRFNENLLNILVVHCPRKRGTSGVLP